MIVTHLVSFLLLGIFFFKESILHRFPDDGKKLIGAPGKEEDYEYVRKETTQAFRKVASTNGNAAFLLESLPGLVFLMNMMILFNAGDNPNTPEAEIGNPCLALVHPPDELALFSQFMAIEHAIFIFTFVSICLFILVWHLMKALGVKF